MAQRITVAATEGGAAVPVRAKRGTGIDSNDIRKAACAANGCRIQGIWDRRQIRANLKQALLTIGDRNLYYR